MKAMKEVMALCLCTMLVAEPTMVYAEAKPLTKVVSNPGELDHQKDIINDYEETYEGKPKPKPQPIDFCLLSTDKEYKPYTFPMKESIESNRLFEQTGIYRIALSLIIGTWAKPGCSDVKVAENGVQLEGFSKDNKLVLSFTYFKNSMHTVFTTRVPGNGTLILDAESNAVLSNDVPQSFWNFLQRAQPAIDGFAADMERIIDMDPRLRASEAATEATKAVIFTAMLTRGMLSAAITCGASLGLGCGVAVVIVAATIYTGISAMSAQATIKRQQEELRRKELEGEKLKKELEEKNKQGGGGGSGGCGPDMAGTPIKGCVPVKSPSPGGSVWEAIDDSLSNGYSYWLDSNGDGQEDTCVVVEDR